MGHHHICPIQKLISTNSLASLVCLVKSICLWDIYDDPLSEQFTVGSLPKCSLVIIFVWLVLRYFKFDNFNKLNMTIRQSQRRIINYLKKAIIEKTLKTGEIGNHG